MTTKRPAETTGGALASATSRLRAAEIPTPRLDAELLLGHVLGKSRTRLAIDANDPIDTSTLADFDLLLTRRIAGEPVAYLIGHREFMGQVVRVGPGVLVPRPETELLVVRAIAMIESLWPDEDLRVLDLCTGSGAIALSLAQEIDDHAARGGFSGNNSRIHITASDISSEALDYARMNRESFGLRERVDLVQGDLLTWTAGPWDLIVSNPPYLRPDQIDGNAEIAVEPRLALDGGENGVELIARILDQAANVAAPRFGMIVELDPDHAHAVQTMAAARFPTADVIIVPDLTGRHRFLSIERKECAP